MSIEYRDFFQMIYGDQVGNVVLGQMDQPGPKGQLNRSWDFAWPHDAANMIAFVEERKGTDLYYSPLIYGDMRSKPDKHGNTRLRRIPENAISCGVVYQDSDTCPVDAFKVKPSIHLQTSSGKYQDIWMLDEPVSANTAAHMSRQIAVAHRADGSDPSSWSANKFLRIPGTTNTRHGFPEAVTAEAWGDVYSTEDLDKHYGGIDVNVYRPIARLIDQYTDSDEDLPDFAEAYNKVHSDEVERLGLVRLVFEPYPEERRSETRYRLLCQLFRVNPPLEFEDILAIAWHAPSCSKWREDARNVRGLIMEAQKAQTEVSYEKGSGVSAAQPGELLVPHTDIERPEVCFLSDDERNIVNNRSTFITEYETWSATELGPGYNSPYARMNAWTILSCAFAGLGFNPRNDDNLNLFSMGVGDSGSGKSSSRRLMDQVINAMFTEDAGWWIGGDASPQALHEALLERDDKVSVLMVDEAHGWFRTINNNQWADGTYEKIALFYDGIVPPIHKTTRREASGKRAKAYFLSHIMGTRKGEMSITNVLNKSMFFSGFLPRFTWYLGEVRVVNEDTLRESNGNGPQGVSGFAMQAQQWAAEFRETTKRIRLSKGTRRVPVPFSDAALDRMTEFNKLSHEIFMARQEWEILEPCWLRFGPSVRRAASLLALEDGRTEVSEADLLCALKQAEEWAQSLFVMASLISESAWAREVDDVENFIVAKGGRALYEVVMRKFKSRKSRDLLEQLNSLYAQGRVKEESSNGKKYLSLNEKGMEE